MIYDTKSINNCYVTSQQEMGKTFEVVVDVMKVGGYLATGGMCFYLLSGGSLPFRVSLLWQIVMNLLGQDG